MDFSSLRPVVKKFSSIIWSCTGNFKFAHQVHHSIRTNQAVHGIIKCHYKYPTIASITCVVHKIGEDKFGIMLWRHDDEDNRPCNSTTNHPDCTKQVHTRKPSVSFVSKRRRFEDMRHRVYHLWFKLVRTGPMSIAV